MRRQLRLVADHARRDALDIRNFRAAQPEGVRAASLLLFGGIGMTFARRQSAGESRSEQQREPEPRMQFDRHRVSPCKHPRKVCGEPQLLRKPRVRVPRGNARDAVRSWLRYNNGQTTEVEAQACSDVRAGLRSTRSGSAAAINSHRATNLHAGVAARKFHKARTERGAGIAGRALRRRKPIDRRSGVIQPLEERSSAHQDGADGAGY